VSANVADRRPKWVQVMDREGCSCSRDESGRLILMPNELCPYHKPKDLRRHQLMVERAKENGHLNELYNLKSTMNGKIAMSKRHIDAVNRQLRELGE
jgi:hypothetical protein